MTTALYPILAQPPHFGNIAAALFALEDADHVIFCVQESNLVASSTSMVKTLELFSRITDKFSVISHIADFDIITSLPKDLPTHDYIITTSNERFVYLLSCGIENVKMVPRLFGFEDAFMMRAYQQGLALDSLRQRARLHPVEEVKKV